MPPRSEKDAFALLGIAPTRDPQVIRRAWRDLVRSYHPDLARQNRQAANARLAEINDAFDLLMAAQARRTISDPDIARRVAAARRAEARRQAEARQAAAEQAAHQAQEAARHAKRAPSEADARPSSGALIASQRNPAVDRAVQAFSSAIASFSGRATTSKHNTTC